MSVPEFPNLKPLELNDRMVFHEMLWAYQPETSELTFTNLFMWRHYYRFSWALLHDVLIIIGSGPDTLFALPPIGLEDRNEAVSAVLAWMKNRNNPGSIERSDSRLLKELGGRADLEIKPTREHFDYVYYTSDLITLPGRSFHAKRNHINQFSRLHLTTDTKNLTEGLLEKLIAFGDRWCEIHRCRNEKSLCAEWVATRDLLLHYNHMPVRGTVILLGSEVVAFSIGELLNETTAVIHAEKADLELQGLYAVINQRATERLWSSTQFVNREQDLGDTGMQKSKESYFPAAMVRKFSISLKKT